MAHDSEQPECGLCGVSEGERDARIRAMQADMEAHIQQHGVGIMGVFGGPEPTDGSFAYTIGLSDRGWPELILQGCSPTTAQTLLNNIAAQALADNKSPQRGDLITDAANLPLRVGTVSPEAVDQYLCQAVYRAERRAAPKPTALQVILCDAEGLFPGEQGFNAERMKVQNCMAPGGKWDFWVN